jgi:hypothetical protein
VSDRRSYFRLCRYCSTFALKVSEGPASIRAEIYSSCIVRTVNSQFRPVPQSPFSVRNVLIRRAGGRTLAAPFLATIETGAGTGRPSSDDHWIRVSLVVKPPTRPGASTTNSKAGADVCALPTAQTRKIGVTASRFELWCVPSSSWSFTPGT